MKRIKKIFLILPIVMFVVLPVFVLAQGTAGNGTTNTSANISISNPASKAGGTLLQVLTTILEDIIMPIAVIFVVVWIIYSGFTFLTAQGNPKKIDEAKQRLLWGLIGTGILLGAAAISAVVERTVSSLFE